MFSTHIYIRLFLQLLGILVVAGGGLVGIFSGKAIILGSFGVLGALILLGMLVSYLNTSNRRVLRFLEAVQDNESMFFFPENRESKEQRRLYDAFNQINVRITTAKMESRKQEHFYLALLEHIPNGIISWDDAGKIRIINDAALQLLDCSYLRHTDQLKERLPDWERILQEASTTGTSLLKIHQPQYIRQLSVSYKRIVQKGENISILTLKDIGRELSEKETESWDKLTHILTHEIMNSIAPIVSLSGTLLSYYQNKGLPKNKNEITDLTIQRTIRGLNTVKSQGQSLMHFTDSYRRLSYLQPPTLRRFSLNHLVDNLQWLLHTDIDKQGVVFSVSFTPAEIVLDADEELLSQVLLNLIKNAMQSLEEMEHGCIRLDISQSHTETSLVVTDNGPGIPQEILEDIFVPFFTTKSSGSGIGLSLSRQIIRMHGGDLRVSSHPYTATRFTITLHASDILFGYNDPAS